MSSNACPNAERLGFLLTDSVSAAEQDELAQHLEECPTCRQRLEELVGGVAASLRELRTNEPSYARPVAQLIANLKVSTEPAAPERAADPLLAAGTKLPYFGDYEILEEVGRGGMGVVYRARQVSLNRFVALKLILAGQLAGDTDVRRFRTEAEAAAMLDHPNIVPIHEIGEHEGRHYFSMKLVEGGSLAERSSEFCVFGSEPGHALSNAKLKTRNEKLATLVATIARAVHYAHQRGVLHRDLKPSNILLDAAGQPHLTDFGLAKLLERDSGLTHSGDVMGTPNYLAPEVAVGKAKEVTTAVDVFSLGAILYELLTGRPPFREETVAATLQKVLEAEPPPPRSLNFAVPRDLETICLKCLEKDPSRRYRSAEALAEDLDRLCRNEPIAARPVGTLERTWRWCRRKPALAGALAALFMVLLCGVTGITWQWQRAEEHARSETFERERAQRHARSETAQRLRAEKALFHAELDRAELLLREDRFDLALAHLARQLRRQPGNVVLSERIRSALDLRGFCVPAMLPLIHGQQVHTARFSPDGRHILTASPENTARLWEARTGAPKFALVHDDAVRNAVFSPDGTLVATISLDGTARLWRVADGQPVGSPLRHEAAAEQLAFSPDGRRLATTSESMIRVWDVATGRLTAPAWRGHFSVVFSVHFSPDGRYLVTTGQAGARIWDVEAGKLAGPTIGPVGLPKHAVFTPDGERILVAHSRIYNWRTDALLNQIGAERGQLFTAFAANFSPDGRKVIVAAGNTGGRIWDLETFQPLTPPLRHDEPVKYAAFSPDGQMALTGGTDRRVNIWNAHTGERLATPIRQDHAVRSAEFSPDGTKVLTVCDGNTAWVWDVRVLQPWTRRFISTGEVTSLRFSRDGKNVLVSSEDHTARLWDAATGRELIPPLWHSNEVNAAAFNPDETRIATAGSDNSVVLWNAATGQRLASRLLADGAMWMVEFDPVGQRLLTGSRGGTVRVWDAALTKEACVIQHEGRLASAHFSPDGSQILTASGDRTARLWDAQTGKPAFDPVRHRSASVNAVFTPDGHRFVTAGQEGTVQVFDRMTGKRCYEPIIYPAPVREGTPEFHPSGKSAATAAGSAVFVWDVNTGAPLLPPLTHREVVLAVKFSADGALLATASQDKTARIWEVATGLPVSEPLPHTSKVVCLAFSPDGRWLATGTAGGSVHMWEAPRLGESPPPWMADLAEALVGQRLDESNQAGAVSVDRLGALREALLQSAANDECTRWAKWLFADGRSRPVSFGASLDLRSYVDSLLRADRLDPLRDAVFLAPTNALAHARLARALLQQSPQEPRPLLAADWNSRYAMNLAPDDSEVRQIREVVIDKLRNAGIGPTVPANEK